MKPINSHSRRRAYSKSLHCIQFYARLDRLIVYSVLSLHENFNLLFCSFPRKAREEKQAEEQISEIVSERITYELPSQTFSRFL